MPPALLYNLRSDARPLIRPPRIFHTFSESCVLYQLVKLINYTHVKYPDILMKVHERVTHIMALVTMLNPYT